MTALRLHLRCWATGPGLPAAGGLAALVVAAAILTIAAAVYAAIPIVNIAGVMLLVLALGGSYVTSLMLPARPCRRRTVTVPVEAAPAPGTRAPRPVTGVAWRGALHSPGRLPFGWARSAGGGRPLGRRRRPDRRRCHMRAAELCAGYGGLFLAMRHAGWPVELAWYAETDPDAARLLAAHHPGVPNAGDIATAQFTAMEPVDVLACGYPCQPFSVAGQRKGTDDHRWIWPDVARAVRLVRPRIVLLENVRGHLAWGFSRVLGDLAGLGYVGSWTCVRASDVGAPHRRGRLFVVATAADRNPVRPEPVPVAARHRPAVVGNHRQGAGGVDLLPTPSPATAEQRMADGRRNLDDAVALLPTPRATRGGSHTETVALLPTPRATDGTKGGPNQRGSAGDLALPDAVQPGRWGAYSAAIRRWELALGRPAPEPTEAGTRGAPRLSARFVEWMQGLPAGHVTDHVGRSAALRLLGNGVVPQQGAHALAHLTATVPTGASS